MFYLSSESKTEEPIIAPNEVQLDLSLMSFVDS
jgi:hypothetical protein